jgi:hypothetical protein
MSFEMKKRDRICQIKVNLVRMLKRYIKDTLTVFDANDKSILTLNACIKFAWSFCTFTMLILRMSTVRQTATIGIRGKTAGVICTTKCPKNSNREWTEDKKSRSEKRASTLQAMVTVVRFGLFFA